MSFYNLHLPGDFTEVNSLALSSKGILLVEEYLRSQISGFEIRLSTVQLWMLNTIFLPTDFGGCFN